MLLRYSVDNYILEVVRYLYNFCWWICIWANQGSADSTSLYPSKHFLDTLLGSYKLYVYTSIIIQKWVWLYGMIKTKNTMFDYVILTMAGLVLKCFLWPWQPTKTRWATEIYCLENVLRMACDYCRNPPCLHIPHTFNTYM